MPSRNVLKVDVPESYYHVYARGASGQNIFLEHDDFLFFLELFRRYLSPEDIRNSAGVAYEKLGSSIEVLAFVVMGNHFHVLLYQKDQGTLQRLMRGIMTSYSRYFNTKYQRTGQLFESRYRASRIADTAHVASVSRYIHLVPKDWDRYPYSSAQYYLGEITENWFHTGHLLNALPSPTAFASYTGDRPTAEQELADIKTHLAHSVI